ncbi:hypothetical protein V8G54_018713 [Vigna mungo]|uniref:Uncharacterized protein n=1 Tax=Vigna mungo TaxID=3915 RepID=A0AAQ3N974_VIGMU
MAITGEIFRQNLTELLEESLFRSPELHVLVVDNLVDRHVIEHLLKVSSCKDFSNESWDMENLYFAENGVCHEVKAVVKELMRGRGGGGGIMVNIDIVFDCGITFVVINLHTASKNKATCEAESTCATNNRQLPHRKNDLVPPQHAQSAAIEFSFKECQGPMVSGSSITTMEPNGRGAFDIIFGGSIMMREGLSFVIMARVRASRAIVVGEEEGLSRGGGFSFRCRRRRRQPWEESQRAFPCEDEFGGGA